MHSILLLCCIVGAASIDDLDADDPNSASIESTGPGLALTVHDVVSIALRSNFDIRSEYISRIAERYDLYVAQDKFKPHVDVTSQVGYVWSAGAPTVQEPNGLGLTIGPHAELLLPTGTLLSADLTAVYDKPPVTTTAPSSGALALQLTQPLLKNRGVAVNMASVQAATLLEDVRKITLKNNIIQTITQVVSSYRDFSLATRQRDIAQVAVQRSKELLDINLQMVAAGRMARADLIQTQSEIATREVNLMNAQSAYIASQVALLQLLALAQGTPIEAVPEEVPTWKPPSRSRALEQALSHRPEYMIGMLNKEIAAKNLIIAENQRQWDLSLLARHVRGGVSDNLGTGWAKPIGGPSHSTFLGLSLSVPLIDVLLRQQVVQSRVAFDQADLLWVQTRYGIGVQLDAAMRTLDIRQRHLALAIRARHLAEKKLSNEREKLGVGRSSNFEVLRFVDDLVNAEIAEITTTIAYLNAVTALQVQLGTLLDPWEVELN